MDTFIVVLIITGILVFIFSTTTEKGADNVLEESLLRQFLEERGYDESDKELVDDMISAVFRYADRFDVDWRLIVGIIDQESRWDYMAINDFVMKDYYGLTHYISFGLGQINTSKQDFRQWSTFDYICEHSRTEDEVRDRGLHIQDVRDNEVRLAIQGDKDSILFDPVFNIFLTVRYISLIKEMHNLTDSEADKICYYYNVGHNASDEGFKTWLSSESYWDHVRNVMIQLSS